MSGRPEVTFDGFVHADDGRLVDGMDRPLQMRGVGLGNWLLPEGYMWRFPREGPQSPREIEALIIDLVGDTAALAFWRRFRERFIDEADIRAIAREGFDHVRLPLSARQLIDDSGDLRAEGLAPIDRTIEWCRRHGLRVVLDLHGAPGGQTGSNIDDSPRGLPDLFLVGGAYRAQTISLWTQLATRYRDETVIAAYDLLNEPLPHEYGDRFGPDLVELYRELTSAIRAVDPNHLLTYEGTRWSTDWSIFSEVWDPNSMLQFHKYWSAPDRPSIAGFIETGRKLSLPIYMGEGGENDLAWLQTAFGLYEDLGISWNLWPWKKLETWTSPVSVVPPAGWTQVVDYASGTGERPSAAEAQRTLDELLDRVRFEACDARPEVVRALFHRVPTALVAASFGFQGEGVSYQSGRAEPLEWFRSDERVTIRSVEGDDPELHFGPSDAPGGARSAFEVVLEEDDWVEYSIEVTTPEPLVIEVHAPAVGADATGLPGIAFDGEVLGARGEDGRAWATTPTGVTAGRHRVRIVGGRPRTVVRLVKIAPRSD